MSRLRASIAFLALALVGASPAFAQTGKPSPSKTEDSLPGGATSLQESFYDWTVSCGLPGGRRVCLLSQIQADQQSKQRALAIEVGSVDAKSISGLMALPFGLELSQGATLQIDDATFLPPLQFQTCLPTGCVAQFKFEGETLAKLRTGKEMKINVQTFEGGRPLVMTVSLKGFVSGLARLQALQ